MKKLLLFSALGALAFDASAQLATSRSMVEFSSKNNNKIVVAPQLDHAIVGDAKSPAKSTAKTTGSGGKRVYSFADYLSSESTTIYSNNQSPYMWHTNNALGLYSDPTTPSGLVADTITLGSYGVTFDPTFAGFNDLDVYDATEIAITDADAYSIDSVFVFGFYGRNTAKTSVVDTLRVAMLMGGGTGTDLPIYYFSGMTAKFLSDTVRFAGLPYSGDSFCTSGTTVVVKNIPLTEASKGDTIPGGMNRFAIPFSGFNVPAGQIVGVSVTFKTGDIDFTPYMDTVFVGSMDAANPFRFGMFRPMILEEATDKYNRYFPGSYNTGFIEFLPQRDGWEGMYLPSYAFLSDSFRLEIPVIEFQTNCVACGTLSVKDEVKLVSNMTAYPNPANSEINVRFTTMQNAKVNVNIVNTLGQVVAVKNMGLQSAGQTVTANISTSGLPSGIYFYTVEANGQRTTSRFSVTH